LAHAGAFQLEATDGPGGAEKVVCIIVIKGYGIRVELRIFGPDNFLGLAERTEHPERKDIGLDQAQCLEVILVILCDRIAFCGTLHGHEISQVIPYHYPAQMDALK
jgi:hypothetical protein